ncbi:hypothetical protein AB3N58_02855 [Leptospira sp. WS60.C2]
MRKLLHPPLIVFDNQLRLSFLRKLRGVEVARVLFESFNCLLVGSLLVVKYFLVWAGKDSNLRR